MATSEGDPIAPIRIISEYSKKMGDRFNIKAAFMDGKVLGAQEIEEIPPLPPTHSAHRTQPPTVHYSMTKIPTAGPTKR